MFTPGKSRILVADDERIIADTLAMILIRSGYEAEAVYNGRQAVEKPTLPPGSEGPNFRITDHTSTNCQRT
jgi:CheY-like chemotaxis protein